MAALNDSFHRSKQDSISQFASRHEAKEFGAAEGVTAGETITSIEEVLEEIDDAAAAAVDKDMAAGQVTLPWTAGNGGRSGLGALVHPCCTTMYCEHHLQGRRME